MPEIQLTLAQIKEALDRLSEDVTRGQFAAEILKDLKLSVDHLRLTLWAIIAYEEQGKRKGRGEAFGLAGELAEFRIKRVVQMLTALEDDFRSGHVAPSDPELASLANTLHSALKNLQRLTGKTT